jgi:glyoxylase-like metal-dependent hydrolase (beta-lactamase superfamily II)
MNVRDILAPNPGPFTLQGTRTYILDDRVLIDPGPAIESHVEKLAALRPQTILITHRHGDHAPAAVPLKRMTGARIVAPEGVLDDVVDQRVADGDVVEGLEVIATPGHTREHVCYLTPDGDLFTGDTILGFGTTTIFPPDGHMGDYLRSLRKLRARAPRRIFPAHGPTRDDAVALIDEYIAHRLERESQVIEALPGTIPALRARIYPDLDPRLEGGAEAQVLAHLIKLTEEGRVANVDGVYRLL